MTNGEGYKELALTDDLRTRLANAGHWMAQLLVVLVPKNGTTTAVENTSTASQAVKRIVNGQVVILREGKTFNALGVEIR